MSAKRIIQKSKLIILAMILLTNPIFPLTSKAALPDGYVKYGPMFDDDLIREAASIVEGYKHTLKNSQEWADKVRLEYYKLRLKRKLTIK